MGGHYSPLMPLYQAQDELRKHAEAGDTCPTCHQFVKVYAKRQIHASIAATLIRVYRAGGGRECEWVYLPGIPQRSRDFSFVAYFDLAYEATERREDGGQSGWWQMTPRGCDWVENRITIPRYVKVYNSRRLGKPWGEPRTIVEALRDPFKYRELMDG